MNIIKKIIKYFIAVFALSLIDAFLFREFSINLLIKRLIISIVAAVLIVLIQIFFKKQ